MSQDVLQVQQLSKAYGKFQAIKSLSFSLKKGKILGLLGPNGAGKTTTIQILLGLTTPDAGEIKYFGLDFAKKREQILQRINFASTYSKLQGKVTVYQNLNIYAGLYGVKNSGKKIKELLELLEISHLKDTLFWKLSSGQQTRAILAKSLINDPEVLLMDEPTASLDPEIINKIIDLIRKLQQEKNLSILFTSHNMEEVSRVCDEVMFLQRGQIVAQDSPENLVKLVGDCKLVVTVDANKTQVDKYLGPTGYQYNLLKNKLVEIKLPENKVAKVLFGFQKHDIYIHNLNLKKPTLEDVFLQIARKNKI